MNPTVEEIVKVISSVNQRKRRDLVNKVFYQKKLSIEEFKMLFNLVEKKEWNDDGIDFFFSKNPSSSDLLWFVKSNAEKERLPLFNKIIEKKFSLEKSDMIEMLSSLEFDEYNEVDIDYFYNLNPNLQEVLLFSNLSKNTDSKLKVRNRFILKGLVKKSEEFIQLYNGYSELKFPESFLDYFFSFNPSLKELDDLKKVAVRENHEKIDKEKQKIIDSLNTERMSKRIAEKMALVPTLSNCKEREGKTKFFYLVEGINEKIKSTTHSKVETCPICMEEKNTFISCPYNNCQLGSSCYSVCTECHNESLEVQIKERNLPLTCDNCNFEILPTELVSERYSSQLEKTVEKYFLSVFPGAKNCSKANCNSLFTEDECDSSGHFLCNCKTSTCIECMESHKGMDCEAHKKQKKGDDAFFKLVHDPKSNFRPCPYCLVPTEKFDACDHINCKGCNRRWDWKLGKRIGRVHYSKRDGSEPRTYRVKGDINQRTGKVYKEYKGNVYNDFN